MQVLSDATQFVLALHTTGTAIKFSEATCTTLGGRPLDIAMYDNSLKTYPIISMPSETISKHRFSTRYANLVMKSYRFLWLLIW
jgi:hypothetical protein